MRKGSLYTKNEDQFIIDARKKGRSYGEIGLTLGRNDDSVRKRHKYILSMQLNPPRIYSHDEDWLIVKYRRQGKTFAEIGGIIKRNTESVANRYYKITGTKPDPRPQPITNEYEGLQAQCEAHAKAVMKEGGFCAFSDNGNKSTGLGVCLPLVWPDRRAYQ